MEQPAAAGCPSCGAAVNGRFCAACGEQKVTERDYSVAHYIGHVFESLTSFDFRTLRAFWALMAKPGRLTRDYLDGRRRIYIGPVQLFVIVNVVFALAGPTSFRTPLARQEHDRPLAAFKQSIVATAMAERAVSREEFTRSFDDNAGLQAKTWIFTFIPLIALVTAALHGFRRFFFEHLIFATHFMAFALAWILIVFILTAGGVALSGSDLSPQTLDYVASAVMLLGLAGYLFPALRRVFGGGRAPALARALGTAVLLYPILVAYRFLLFFVTLWTMH